MYLPSLISNDYTKKERHGLPTVPPLLRPWLNSLVELVALALVVVRVEKLLRLLAAGLAEVVLVKGLNLGVEMAHAEGRLLIIGVETGRALGADRVRREAGLTAAADATAAARHHFDEVVARLDAVLEILADLIKNLLDVAHLVGDRDVDRRALDTPLILANHQSNIYSVHLGI